MPKVNYQDTYNTFGEWRIITPRYYDFILYPYPITGTGNMPDECFMGTIDPNISYIDDMGNIYSSNVWDKSVNSNVQLDDYGLCSVDDGKTKYDKETDILENVLFDTPLTTGDDLRFKMSKIDGNFYTSPKVDYSVSIKEENDKKFISASGGGFSGCPKYYIPKSVGEYNTLPTRVEQYQTFEFVIRPTQEIKDNTLSYYNPDNFGFFFFYGQRENKWLYYYQEQSNDKTAFEKMLTSQGIIMDTPNMVEIETNNKYLWTNRSCCGWTIFDKDYPHEIVMQYQKKNPNLNYYLLFNRSVDKLNHYKGLTVTTVNPLSMLNCCSHTTGYYDELRKQYPCDSYLQYNLIEKHLQNFPDDLKGLEIYNTNYDYVQDISNKAFGFRITPSGAISYRTISKNCGEDKDLNPVIVAEEYSNDNIIKFGEWNYIVIKIIYDTYIENPECSTYPARNGIIYVYVNGYLKWASKKWKEPVLKELNEHWSKQLGTLNMNLMIGSQGLMETILSNNDQDYPRIVLPTEKYFAGNLVGDLLFFRMGTCNITYKQIQELTTYRKIELGKPELNPPPECVFPKIVETIVFTEYVCQMTSKIVRANITTGGFYSAAMGQDNKLYFCGLTNNGIMFLDDDGEIKPTNITTGNFYSAAMGQDNKLYFCGYRNNGIMFLDDDGEIKPTNITTGYFYSAAMGQDNKLYFCSNISDKGIMFLDDDGEIKPTNITTGNFYSAAIVQNNKVYFCSSDNGIMFLDDDGEIKPTNITTGDFHSVAMGQDNKLYFCSGDNGIMFLDDDGEIKPTNITTNRFYSAAMGQDNKLYFCGYINNGIMFLDDDGEIKPTNITTGDFYSAAMGQDNKLYFCGLTNNGIMFLDDDGEIKPTNITTNRFYSAAMGQDNKLYFCSSNSDNGVFRLDSTMSGKAFATSATYKRHENDKLTNESMKSLLTDVLPEMTKLKYQLLSESVVEERAKAVVSLFDLETSPKYMSMTIINDKRCLI